MAFDKTDCYEVLSDGMYSGSLYEVGITDTERYTRILSHGLLSEAPAPVVGADDYKGLNDVGTSTTL